MSDSLDSLFEPSAADKKSRGPIFRFSREVRNEHGDVELREFVSVAGVELPVNQDGVGTQYEAAEFEDFALDEKALELLKVYATAIKLNQPPLVEGPTDIGKSKVLEYLAFLTNHHLLYQSFSGQTDVSELIGKFVPNTADARRTFERLLLARNRKSLSKESLAILEAADDRLSEAQCQKIAELEGLSFERVEWIWQDGTVPRAMEFNGGEGCWLYFDELGAAEPQVLVKLNRIFSRGVKRLELTEDGGREVVSGPQFRLIATTNPPSYAGREPFEEDFLRRWVYRKVGNLTQTDFIKRLDALGRKKYEVIPGTIDLSRIPEVDHVLNELIALFRDSAQRYLEALPRDAGEQKFRLGDFSDAARVQEYLRQLQGPDLLKTLREAVEFYYIGKVHEQKKDASGNNVQNRLRAILEELFVQKRSAAQIKGYLDAFKDPELIKKRDLFDRRAKDLAEEKQSLRRQLGLSGQESSAGRVSLLSAWTYEGRPVEIDLNQSLQHWKYFYSDWKITWGADALPQELSVSTEQAKEMEKLMAMGFTEVIIIPEGLDPAPAPGMAYTKEVLPSVKVQELFSLLMAGYNSPVISPEYTQEGGVGASQANGSSRGRIVLVKPSFRRDDAQSSATDHYWLQELRDESIHALALPGFPEEDQEKTLAELGLLSLDEVAYWLYQREFYDNTGELLDDGNIILPGSRRVVSNNVPGIRSCSGSHFHFESQPTDRDPSPAPSPRGGYGHYEDTDYDEYHDATLAVTDDSVNSPYGVRLAGTFFFT